MVTSAKNIELYEGALRSVIAFHDALDAHHTARYKADAMGLVDETREAWHEWREKVEPLLKGEK